ncbi:transcription initiation factor IIB chain b [Pyrococcus furiosus COM1]|uniref:Transcription initiation factor IIB n=1 Tax=Pyrococcus furiosus COM1 TaxID=1185654 RepID=I6UXX8_9EURY|nr:MULTISPECIES: TFIIB-type zinc ribbon-containing protein [Pyrococcus]AFN03480.1 transcription initiation factor IIB chain b [Pyrococcus furiosus COM1]
MIYPVKCPYCKSRDLVYDRQHGEVFCKKCGSILATNLVDSELSRKTKTNDIPRYTKRIGEFTREKIYRLRKWQKKISSERNLVLAMSELRRLSGMLKLPKYVEEEAAYLYREAAKRGLTRRIPIETTVAACIYATCRLFKVPRTLNEIASYSKTEKKEIMKAFRVIVRNLNLTPKMLLARPTDYVDKFADELELSERVRRRTVDILRRANEEGITSGKNPLSLVAAALYIASLLEGERRSQKEIARVTGVSEMTVRNRYKELVMKLGLKSLWW